MTNPEPLSEERLSAIEARAKASDDLSAAALEDIDALISEVRRLRAALDSISLYEPGLLDRMKIKCAAREARRALGYCETLGKHCRGCPDCKGIVSDLPAGET